MIGSQLHGARFRAATACIISAFAFTLAASETCFATGYFGPSDYLSRSEKSIEASPEFYWECEVKRLASAFHPIEKLHPSDLGYAESSQEKAGPLLKSTGNADLSDFAAASKEGKIKPVDPAKATQQHAAARDLIAATDEKQTTPLPEEFDSEFADYHRGAYAFRLGKDHWEEARKIWEGLLNRPAAERHYRTVWAAFMLGKLAMKNGDYPAAVKWFQKTRELAKEGFADSLGMAADSYGWEGRCEWKQNHPDKAAPLFLTQLALGDNTAVISLKALIPDRAPVEGMLNYGPESEETEKWSAQEKEAAAEKALRGLKAAAADPLLRRLVTTHILAAETSSSWFSSPADQSAKRCSRWLAAIEDAKISKVEDAEYLGWVAYTSADYKAAAHWLELTNSDTPAANWLRAKLQRRAGQLDQAAKSMERAWQTIIQPGAYTGRKQDAIADAGDGCNEHHFSEGGFSFPGAASGDLALLRLARGEFVQAMDTFLKGGLFSDAAYVAERVLSADELKAYVDRQSQPEERTETLRYLLGRRLVREDRYDEAAKYLKPPYDRLLEKYVQALKDGADTKLPKQKRADAWLTAAWLARYDGMELMGTEVAPDGFGSGGMFPDLEIAKLRQAGKYDTEAEEQTRGGYVYTTSTTASKPMVLPPSKEEIQRLAKHKISPDIRYHYRVIAATLAEKGSRFLDDNTEELADVLNTAGLWIKDRDEKLGNHIYGLIEKRCPKTKIGAAVISRHWFVDEAGPWRPQQKAAYEALHKELGVPDERQP